MQPPEPLGHTPMYVPVHGR